MANKKVTELSELASVEEVDVLYIIDDPSGTPASRKVTVLNVIKGGLPLTTHGDILWWNNGTLDRLGMGTAGQALKVNGTGDGYEWV